MDIAAKGLDFQALNRQVKAAPGDVCIRDCCGQRFIGSGLKDKTVTIHGTPGNALGAYLDGAVIEVHGNAGDALGYAMRGGAIYVRGDAGYRAGIHMKAYEDKQPVIVIGGRVGSFLGEYLAGGTIIVLGIGASDAPLSNFTGTGMHGGRILIRTAQPLPPLPAQVTVSSATAGDMEEAAPYVREFARRFRMDADSLLADEYVLLRPNAKNPYQQLYTPN